MRTLGIIIFLILFLISTYFQKKSSTFMKEEYKKKGFFIQYQWMPMSLDNTKYRDERGPRCQGPEVLTSQN